MNATSTPSKETPAEIPFRFLVRFGLLVKEVHGLPSEGYAASKADALAMFRDLGMVQIEDVARHILSRNRAGALALLHAIIVESNRADHPLSLPEINASKKDDYEWAKGGFLNVSVDWFFRVAIGKKV